ncbi:MAG: hypothetical protein ACOC2N_07870 [Spirochaetota bacterium]
MYAAYFDSGADESRSIVFYGFQLGTSAASVGSTLDVYEHDGTAAADVAMAIESDGTTHLAYQSGSGYLKYANLTYDGGGGFTVNNEVFADALFGAGTANAIALRDHRAAGDLEPGGEAAAPLHHGCGRATRGLLRLDARRGNLPRLLTRRWSAAGGPTGADRLRARP